MSSLEQSHEALTDSEAPPASGDATERIGERLAHLRRMRRMNISQLARRISVSPSLISQIERGQSRPSVTTLFALAQELEVPVDAFFGDEPVAAPDDVPMARSGDPVVTDAVSAEWHIGAFAGPAGYVLRRGDRPTVDIRGGVRWERLTRSALSGLEFMELVYQPGAESDTQLYRHPGVELVLVTENRLQITVGFDVNELEAGDSIAFPSSLPHRYANPTESETRAVTVILRDDLSTLPVGPSGERAAN
jgi:transcriptional regulator with XRE-family HTH domain/quercetin dioxygenase-like cupin family protein